MIRSFAKAGAVAAVALVAAFAAAQDVKVTVDKEYVYFPDVQPQQINGQVLVPIRSVLEQMGGTVSWDEPTHTITCYVNGSDLILHIGDAQATVNGMPEMLDMAPIAMNDRVLVPITFLSNSLGTAVNWSNEDNLVTIQTSNGTSAQTPIPATTYALHKYEIVPVALDNSLSSMYNHAGDTFSATVTSSDTEGYAGLPAGTRIEGHVAAVEPMTEDMPSALDLAFDRIVLPDGQTLALDGSLTSLDDTYTMESDDGTFEAQGDAMTYPKMVFVGYGNDTGTLVGLDSDLTLDAAVLTDSLSGLQMEVPPDARVPVDITLPAGTTFGVRIDEDVTIP